MGKAGRWLRSFLPGGRRGRDKAPGAGEPDQALALALPPGSGTATTTTTPASTPGAKEKRRWSFRRAPGPPAKDSPHGRLGPFLVEPRLDPDQHAVAVAIATAAAAEAALAAKRAASAAVRLSASKRTLVVGIEDAAAIKIQAAFRSYLARKALCALRGLVKLQALVRGHLVRRQASHTLRCMQALVAAQDRARAARLRLLDVDLDDDRPSRTARTTPTRRSPHHPRLRHHNRHHQDAEENVKIVEVDTGGEAHGAGTPRASRRSSCYATPLCRTPSRSDLYRKISPTPSALTDASARAYSGRYEYDDFSFATARASPCRYDDARHHAPPSRPHHHHHDRRDRDAGDHPMFVPGYMANTESSRAKARSQSAPRQRLSVSSAAEAAWERQQPAGGRRRASLEGQATPGPGARGAAAAPRCGAVRVQRCPSQASSCPWGARLDRWSASAHDSECGSTSTVMTAATTTYCWSLADNAGMA